MEDKYKNFEVTSNGDSDIFLSKLTLENNWTSCYAREIFSEYMKFIWLAKISQKRIVPSESIDIVWHLHMTFTKSYWCELCKDILGFELHHTPSSKNLESKNQDERGYQYTLRLYEKEFRNVPPTSCWTTRAPKRSSLVAYGLLAFFTATFLTACSLESNEDFISVLKWGVGIFVGLKVLNWLSSNGGSGKRGW